MHFLNDKLLLKQHFVYKLFDYNETVGTLKENINLSHYRLHVQKAVMIPVNDMLHGLDLTESGHDTYNNFTTALRLAKNNYFQRKFTECSNNSRDTWKTLNSLILCKNRSKDITLNHNGSAISAEPLSHC